MNASPVPCRTLVCSTSPSPRQYTSAPGTSRPVYPPPLACSASQKSGSVNPPQVTKLIRSVSVMVREAVRNTVPTTMSSNVCPCTSSGALIRSDSDGGTVRLLGGSEVGCALLAVRRNALAHLGQAEAEELHAQ